LPLNLCWKSHYKDNQGKHCFLTLIIAYIKKLHFCFNICAKQFLWLGRKSNKCSRSVSKMKNITNMLQWVSGVMNCTEHSSQIYIWSASNSCYSVHIAKAVGLCITIGNVGTFGRLVPRSLTRSKVWSERLLQHHVFLSSAPAGNKAAVQSSIKTSDPCVRHRVVSRARLFGSGLSLSKCFDPISGLHTKLFNNIQSNDFFVSWRTFVVLTEVIVFFFS